MFCYIFDLCSWFKKITLLTVTCSMDNSIRSIKGKSCCWGVHVQIIQISTVLVWTIFYLGPWATCPIAVRAQLSVEIHQKESISHTLRQFHSGNKSIVRRNYWETCSKGTLLIWTDQKTYPVLLSSSFTFGDSFLRTFKAEFAKFILSFQSCGEFSPHFPSILVPEYKPTCLSQHHCRYSDSLESRCIFHLPDCLGTRQKCFKFMNNETQMLDFAHVHHALFFSCSLSPLMDWDLQEKEFILGNEGI